MEISYVGHAVEYCRRFGQVAVERGLITAAQLLDALATQVEDDLAGAPHRLLGDILMENGLMTAGQVDAVLNESLGLPPAVCRTVR